MNLSITRSFPRGLVSGAMVVFAIVMSGPVLAATYRMPSDDVLIRKAGFIVRGWVTSAVPVVGEDGGLFTDAAIQVEETLKGADLAPAIVVRQPGGRINDRIEVYPGLGSLVPGSRVFLMLTPIENGRFRVTDFALGNFRVILDRDGRSLLRREGLREATVQSSEGLHAGPAVSALAPSAEPLHFEAADPDREDDAFESYVRAIVAGRPAAADYRRPPTSQSDSSRDAEFVFLGAPPARWKEFETGGTITYRDNANGDAGTQCQPGGCHAQVSAGLLKWNDIPGAEIRLAYGGTDASIGNTCLTDLDNQIQFNDPCHEIDDLSGCSGVLALGGFANSTASGGSPACVAMGTPTFERITSAKIMVNNGTGNCLDPCDYTEMIAHETGHTLGAGHSLDVDALMRAFLHHGLCGEPRPDDAAFAQCVYPQTQMTCGFQASKTWTGPPPVGVAFHPVVLGGLTPFTYDYDFGDGTTESSTQNPTHVYGAPGTYTADLVVRDSDSRTCTDHVSITIQPCSPSSATSVAVKVKNGLYRALVSGLGFSKGSVVQIDKGEGFVSVPSTAFKSRKKLIAKDVGDLWPIGVAVQVRVLGPSPELCPSNPLASVR